MHTLGVVSEHLKAPNQDSILQRQPVHPILLSQSAPVGVLIRIKDVRGNFSLVN